MTGLGGRRRLLYFVGVFATGASVGIRYAHGEGHLWPVPRVGHSHVWADVTLGLAAMALVLAVGPQIMFGPGGGA